MAFDLSEATVAGIHDAFVSGELSAEELVAGYLTRIESVDKRGPALNSIVALNERAIDQARQLDEQRRSGAPLGPLHGVPLVVKDQAETVDVPTTFGSAACDGYQPATDATAVQKLKEAGAIILAKTTLPDFATSWFSFSSVSGTTKNPYDLARDPGGSSSGTAAAVAANLAAIGVGEDTGGSIRLPASFCGLVGLRVTPGMISRNGMSPLVGFQDTAGPMARTVADLAVMLEAMVGYDSADPYTSAYVAAGRPSAYRSACDPNGLAGKRIGILRAAFGPSSDPDSASVNHVMEEAIAALTAAGAEVIDPVDIPDLASLIEFTSLYVTNAQHDIDAFLSARPSLKLRTVREIHEAGLYHTALDLFEAIVAGPRSPEEDPDYHRKYIAREEFARVILNVFGIHRLDAVAYPSVQVPAPTAEDLAAGKWGTLTFPTNTLIAAQSWLPAITVPAGFTGLDLPVGLELMGRPHGERELIGLASGFEAATRARRPPQL